MLKKTFILLVTISTIIFSMSIIKIEEKDNKKNISKIIDNIKITNKESTSSDNNDTVAYLIIDKLQINKPLYSIESEKNNIEENITILKGSTMPTDDNSIMFIAAHSGTGYIAFFKDLDKLKENDIVRLIYNNEEYTYIVKNIWEEEKNGYINVSKDKNKQLILTTCSPNNDNYQLIVNCILKS